MKITEQEQRILDTANKLRPTLRTKGWEYIIAYSLVRTKELKNALVKMDFVNEASLASKKQGMIQGIESIFNRVKNVMAEAEIIEKAMAEEKKKEKK